MLDKAAINDKVIKTTKVNSKLMGQIKYFKIKDWKEHKMIGLTDLNYMMKLFQFIEDATSNYKSCMIVSKFNKCSTVVVGMVYFMIKYKWSTLRTLEYLNARKHDIEITKAILK